MSKSIGRSEIFRWVVYSAHPSNGLFRLITWAGTGRFCWGTARTLCEFWLRGLHIRDQYTRLGRAGCLMHILFFLMKKKLVSFKKVLLFTGKNDPRGRNPCFSCFVAYPMPWDFLHEVGYFLEKKVESWSARYESLDKAKKTERRRPLDFCITCTWDFCIYPRFQSET